jgi:hypothetical protein
MKETSIESSMNNSNKQTLVKNDALEAESYGYYVFHRDDEGDDFDYCYADLTGIYI